MHKRLALTLAVSSVLFACAEEDGAAPSFDYTADASSVLTPDAALPSYDGGFNLDAGFSWEAGAPFDAGLSSDASLALDAAQPNEAGANRDAATDGAAPVDGSTNDASAPRDGGTSDSGVVNGNLCPGSATPHGCYKAKAGNPMGCPAQIFEQSAFYPPVEEWKGCSSPYYTPCIYLRPDGSEANCSCDLGLHWLCTY